MYALRIGPNERSGRSFFFSVRTQKFVFPSRPKKKADRELLCFPFHGRKAGVVPWQNISSCQYCFVSA